MQRTTPRVALRAAVAFGALALAFVTGCDEAIYTVRIRAEHELPCAEGHVVVVPEGAKLRFRATGCGRTTTYTCIEIEELGTPICSREGEPR